MKIQVQGTPTALSDIDVDRCFLDILEEEMFHRNSARAGEPRPLKFSP